MSSPLAYCLQKEVWQARAATENTAFIKCFLKGVVTQESFRQLIANLYGVYCVLEAALQRHRQHPIVGQMYFPELYRTQNLEEDLAFYYGEQWQDQIFLSSGGQAYIDRIRGVEVTQPALLVAHAYARYMEDLSIGQSVKEIARSAMALPSTQGTRLYEFDLIPTPEAKQIFKSRYCKALNALAIDEDLSQALVFETNYAFSLQQLIFRELESDLLEALSDHLVDLLGLTPYSINPEPSYAT